MKTIKALIILLALVSIEASAKDESLRRVNFSSEFIAFIEQSKEMDESGSWQVWRKTVEMRDPAFFHQVIGGSNHGGEWLQAYETRFKRSLPYLRKYSKQIVEEFRRFDATLIASLEAFRTLFPSFDISDVPVYAVPSLMSFNGRAAFVDQRMVLAFGIDLVALLKEEPNLIPGMESTSNSSVLYSHEMFHVFHNKKLGLTEEKFIATGSLLHMAWVEGLAVYASSVLNPSASIGDLLMDSALGRVCETEGHELLKAFSAVAATPFNSPDGPELHNNWFLVSSRDQRLAKRAGYCVGYLIAKKASSNYSIRQMTEWRFEEVVEKILPFLN